MITGKDIYNVFAALVPLYVAMMLAYGSVRWWKIFTPDQCSGINRFVAVFGVPLLSFHIISSNNPYAMNYRFIAADSLQKVVILAALFVWNTFTKHGNLNWTITIYALSTLPNTLVMGIPLLKAMYGDFSATLMVQIVVLQSVIWNTFLLFMFEYRGAKLLIAQQFPETAASITSFKVDSDVVSLNGREPLLETDSEIEENGKLHVVVRRSSVASSRVSSFNKSHFTSSITPRASNLTEVEIYSVQSSNNGGDVLKEVTPRTSNFEEDMMKMHKKRGGSAGASSPNPMLSRSTSGVPKKRYVSIGVAVDHRHAVPHETVASKAVNELIENMSPGGRGSTGEREVEIEEAAGTKLAMNGSPLHTSEKKVDIEEGDADKKQQSHHQMPPASVMTKLILIMVWRKFIRNPNTYASLLGIVWSLISYRWHIEMPTIVKGSISILSDAGLGMAMFSLGLFMALQPKIIACGKSMAAFAMAVRFFTGPAVIAATSAGIGLRGDLLRVAIVQAALPQGIITFVFAKEYNLHADIISTSVIFGMLVALPITILYYVLLGVL